ncbi:MAG: hypothetical protein HGB19_04205 [Chlorobiales bacterium]|nr:hypothetical protein [Chlorobiales bacterium]
MNITPTPVTAALAGVFSAIVWPFLWSWFGGASTDGGIGLIVGTLLVIALPAHAFVMGFGGNQGSAAGTLDTALLKRVGAWLAGAAVTSVVDTALRG